MLVGQLALWTFAMGLVYFSIYVLFPFTFTVLAERSASCAEAMTVRELLTNMGRVAGAGVVVISITFTGGLAPALAVGGIALLGLAGAYLRIRGQGSGDRVQGDDMENAPQF